MQSMCKVKSVSQPKEAKSTSSPTPSNPEINSTTNTGTHNTNLHPNTGNSSNNYINGNSNLSTHNNNSNSNVNNGNINNCNSNTNGGGNLSPIISTANANPGYQLHHHHHQPNQMNWKSNCSNRFVGYPYPTGAATATSPAAGGAGAGGGVTASNPASAASYGRPLPTCQFFSYSPSVIYLPVSYPAPPPGSVTLQAPIPAPPLPVQTGTAVHHNHSHHHHHHIHNSSHLPHQQQHTPFNPVPTVVTSSSLTGSTLTNQQQQLTTSPSPPPTIIALSNTSNNYHTNHNNHNSNNVNSNPNLNNSNSNNYLNITNNHVNSNNHNNHHHRHINLNHSSDNNNFVKLIPSNDLLSYSLLGKNNEALQFLSKGAQVIVRMRGLPYDCTDQKVIEFFASGKNGCDVMDGTEGVLFVRRGDGRPTGDAFVLFDSEEMAIKALHKHRESIGSRYIELFRSSTAEVQQVLNRAMDFRLSETNTINLPQMPLIPHQLLPSGSRRDCIRLRGLPYEAQVEQILEFLGENAKNIVFRGVHMVYNAQGQPSGEAFIQMDSEQSAALTAAQRHHKYMSFGKKQRYIEVFQCSIDDMNLVLTGGVPLQRHLQATGTILPAPYRTAYPYIGGAPVLSAATAALTGATGVHPTSYYHPIIYWPYPSPPVSPTTYYTHSGPTMITSECIQIPQPPLSPSHHLPRNGVPAEAVLTNGGEGLVTFPPRLEAERAIQEKNRANIATNRCIELYLA